MATAKNIYVAFLSLSAESSIDHLIECINNNTELRCTFSKLTHQDLQLFQPQDTYDAVVLLHSISQGRNSITDVADAKYRKLLPQLKEKYGSNRVAVIVHSMTSFNPASKSALMMVFKMSQPTTFKCSECVIQCNNPAEIPDDDLARLIEFLKEALKHPLPTQEVEAPLSRTVSGATDVDNNSGIPGEFEPEQFPESKSTSTSANESSSIGVNKNRLHGPDVKVPGGAQMKTSDSSITEVPSTNMSELKDLESDSVSSNATVSAVSTPVVSNNETAAKMKTRDTDDQPSTPSTFKDPLVNTSSQGRSTGFTATDVNSGSMGCMTALAHSTNPPDETLRYTYPHVKTQQDAASWDTSPFNKGLNTGYNPSTNPQGLVPSTNPSVSDNQIAMINNTYPIALVVLPRSKNEETFKDAVQHYFPDKIIVPMKDMTKLDHNWHLFEAILIDVGTMRSQKAHDLNRVVSGCLRSTYDWKNVALLESSTVTANPHSTAEKSVHQLDLTHQLPVFQYNSDSSGQSRFDDATERRMVVWLCDCFTRYVVYVNSQPSGWLEKGMKKIRSMLNLKFKFQR